MAFFVGEIPCAPFITALVNGVAEKRRVLVCGAERTGDDDGFAPGVVVEKCPRSRWDRFRFAARRLLMLLARRTLAVGQVWRYMAARGLKESPGRLLLALPLLVHRPEIVHIQWAKALTRVMELRQLFPFAVVLSLRGTHISSSPFGNPDLAQAYRLHLPRVHAFHAVCCAIRSDAVALGAAPERIRVIYSGVDNSLLLEPMPPLRECLAPLRVLSVGRMHWRKGYHHALDAIGRLRESQHVHFRIIAGEPDDELKWQMEDLALQGIVEFCVTMSRTEVIREMRNNADVLLVPSVGEGIANVAIEAMAVGLPVVATSCGGMGELVETGETGLLCDAWNAESMALALLQFAGMPLAGRERLRRNARAFVAGQRRLDDLVKEMHLLYNDAATRNQKEGGNGC